MSGPLARRDSIMVDPSDVGGVRRVSIAEPAVGDEEWQALREPLATGWLTQGPKVAAFERAFAERHQAHYAIATTSCTTALHLALVALGIGPGDEVIVPAFTWVATANVVLYCGATPVFVDVDRTTFNISPADVAEKLTSRTKAVIPVHLFGLCADVDALCAVLTDGIAIVEDAACAAGAEYKGRPAGTLGACGVFSFHPRKAITCGEGGMLTTNDSGLAECAISLRNHGAALPEETRHGGPQPYLLPEFNLLGFNYRMTDLQGAVGLVQLTKLDRFISERQRWADYYRRELSSLEWLRPQALADDSRHAWQAYVCYVDPECAPAPRDQIMARLSQMGVAARPGTHAVHMLAYYRERFGLVPEDYPAARDCAENTMALPLHNRMTAEDYAYVIECLHRIG